jgi:hypothetical protein
MNLNVCVQLDGLSLMTVLIVTYSSPGPSASQNAGRGCVNFFGVLALVGQEPFLNRARIAESQPEGRLSEQRVEVTGSCSLQL